MQSTIPSSRVELLAPAGNFEKLETAIHFGADAVYLGGREFNLRSHSGNFSRDELEAAVAYCRQRDIRAYVTCNIFPRNSDLEGLRRFLQDLAAIRPDGLIVADPSVFTLAREAAPAIPIHISTQANTTSVAAAHFWKKLGASRINAARELHIEEIKEICDQGGVAVEVFVHGAMCMAYSGRCLLSSYLANRDGNRGRCAHPCRWDYALVEEKRPGMYMPIDETDRGSFIINSRDLCMIAHIPELIASGVAALKIEGRMKGIHYVATVVKAYREAIDAYYRQEPPGAVQAQGIRALEAVNHRGYDTGFYFGPPCPPGSEEKANVPGHDYRLVGKVLADGEGAAIAVDTRNRFFKGEIVEMISPGWPITRCRVRAIRDAEGHPIERARPGFKVTVDLAHACRRGDLLRRVRRLTADRSTDR
ncbi:MAG: U32 family peptidase [Desulfobacterales bacterium]|nr:U32 family peptidase [Desulfobacterales bacterium]